MNVRKCPNCNAPIVYQDKLKVYKCEYCGSEYNDGSSDAETNKMREMRVIHEYRHVPEQLPSSKANKERKGTSGFLRFVFALLGVCSALMGAGALSVNQGSAGIVLIGIGIWLIVLASRKK